MIDMFDIDLYSNDGNNSIISSNLMNSNSNLHAHVHYQPHTANLNNNSSSVSPINSPINTTNHNTNNSSTNSNFATADSLSGNSKPFVVCRVCGDKSSGLHYGIQTCEGARRSIQKQIEYRCLRDGKCQVVRLNRNRCQYCRFKKCLAVGMSRDSVRYGRVPKKSRDKSEQRDNLVTQSNQDNQLINSSNDYSTSDSIPNLSLVKVESSPLTNCMIGCTNGNASNLNHPLIKSESQVTSSNGLKHNGLKHNASSTIDNNYTELSPITNSLTNHDHNNLNHLNGSNPNDLYELIMNIEQAHHSTCEYVDELSIALKKKGSISSNGSDYNSSTNSSPVICGAFSTSSSTINGPLSNQSNGSNCMSPFTHSSASSSSSISNSTVSSSAELSPQVASPDSGEQHRLMLWQRFANLITPSIHRIVEFAKRIPNFLQLNQDDQLILIKLGFFECWLVHMSKWFNSIEGTLTFSCGSIVNVQQLQIIFDHQFPASIFDFMNSFNRLQLDASEIGLFTAIVILQSERAGVFDTKTIYNSQQRLLEALKFQLSRNHPLEMYLYSNLMGKLNELRVLSDSHAKHLHSFRTKWNMLSLPPLFAEIFDIPKPELH